MGVNGEHHALTTLISRKGGCVGPRASLEAVVAGRLIPSMLHDRGLIPGKGGILLFVTTVCPDWLFGPFSFLPHVYWDFFTIGLKCSDYNWPLISA
jgi:hypothetical protein